MSRPFLSAQSRRRFWQLIKSIKSAGKTIVLTTHYMDEAELLCDDLAIMDNGKLVDRGAPQALLEKHLPHKQVTLDANAVELPLEGISGEVIVEHDQLVIITRSVEQCVQELIARNIDLSTLKVRNPTLEDLFIKLTGHQLRE